MIDSNPSTSTIPHVAIVDDDDDLRESLSWLLDSVGLHTRAYASGDAFLDDDPQQHDAILLDVRMPGLSGLQVQQRLQGLDACPPVIMITGHGDVAMAVSALKAGAVDFIEKPFNQQQLIDILQQVLAEQRERADRQQRLASLHQRYAALRPREQDILKEVACGFTSREIAEHLALSAKTVEVYRQRIMKALGATSLAHLIRLSVALELVDILPDHELPRD